MLSRLTAIIMAIVSFITSFGAQLPAKSEVFYDVAYGKYTRQVMDIAFSEKYEKTQPVILFIHGGGWIGGSKSGFTGKSIPLSEKFGCITASMNYRYASQKVDCSRMLEDIDKALAKIKSMAETRGIKVNKAMLVGYSAGAHLALLYAYSKKSTAPIKPAAVVSYSGPTDLSSKKFVEENALSGADYMRNIMSRLTGETITASNFKSKKKALLKISPINYVSSSCVPTIVVQGAKDQIVYASDTRKLISSLKAKGVTHKYFELPNSGHQLKDDPDLFSQSDKAFSDYVKKYLK